MGADVADRSQCPAALGLEPPVPVGLEQQPVLEVAPGDQPHVADLARGHDLVGVLVERVVADVEVRGVDQPGRGGQGDQLARLRRRHRQRLLADDVLARGEDGLGLRQMQIIGRGDMDGVDRRVVEQGLERRVGARDAERLGPGRAAFRGAAEHAADLDADAAQGFDVDRADEARADHGRADVGDPPHATFTPWLVRARRRRPGGGEHQGPSAIRLPTREDSPHPSRLSTTHPSFSCQVQKRRFSSSPDPAREHSVRGP